MFKCPLCPQQRPSRSRLQSHINVVHSFGKTGKVVLPAAAPDVPNAAVDTSAEPLAHPNAARFAPASDTIRQQGRADLAKHFAETGARLAKAGEEIQELKTMADAVARRLEALDAMATSPAAVRRASLLSAYDRLMDCGNVAGAQVVMKMINSGGDW